jgi:hypothetical protein
VLARRVHRALTRGQARLERVTFPIEDRVNLGRETATRATERMVRHPFRQSEHAGAACEWKCGRSSEYRGRERP